MSQSTPLRVPVRGKSGGGQDLPTTAQSTPLWVPVRGKSGGRQSLPTTAVCQALGNCDPESNLPCSCPRRQFREPPESLPMPATASNRGALEEYIKEWYASRAFKVCKRQTWPRTAGPAMRIFTKPDATPVCVTKPAPVPLHSRKEVKANLDVNVAMEVLERVPMGTPDTRCTRMVITP